MNINQACTMKCSIILLGCLYLHSTNCFAQEGRFSLRGLAGSATYADVDGSLSLRQDCNSLLYTDLQAKYSKDDDWFAGLGLGYRYLKSAYILGGNVFIDRAKSEHHNHYWILSPGVETIMPCWDVRLNGYIPVSGRRQNEGSFFPSGLNDCGIHGDCSFVEFSGHQQFEHRFLKFEEVGPGADLIAGINLPCCGCINLHGGVYYYHLTDADDITGIGARLDVPINDHWAVTGEASYDNEEHGAVAIGLRFQLGHTPKYGCCPNLCDRLFDPVLRHIGPIERGTGIPVVRGKKDEGLFLRRDNIYFFSEEGTAELGEPGAGTFENPFADDQLTDATVSALGNNANLYFATGRYVIDPGTPDNRVSLLQGQSIFGRTENFKCTAVGDERPTLEGGIDLTNSRHTIDSITLENVRVGPTTVIGLNLSGADDVHLCNDVIRVQAVVPAINTGNNVALGIAANDSDVTIDNSVIEALALVGSDNGSPAGIVLNAASAIGNFNADFANNVFVITNSKLSATAQILGTNFGLNYATTIGNHSITGGIANFTNNDFTINNSALSSLATERVIILLRLDDNRFFNFASVIGNNTFLSAAVFTDNNFIINTSTLNSQAIVQGENDAFNFATTIGNNSVEIAGASPANFTDNNFKINNSALSSEARVKDFNFGINFAATIGNNTRRANSDFNGNVFLINNSSLNALARVEGDSRIFNFATNIGNNSSFGGIANFAENIFLIDGSSLSSIVSVGGNAIVVNFNYATNIGNNVNEGGPSNFNDNEFKINCSTLNSLALIEGDNEIDLNFATNIGNNAITAQSDFNSNDFIINNSALSATAEILGDNFVNNFATGIGNNIGGQFAPATNTFANNTFNINCTSIEAQAIIHGGNLVVLGAGNLAIGVNLNNENNSMTISSSIVEVLALVEGINAAPSRAVGLSSLGSGSVLRIFDSFVNVAAIANAEPNTATGSEGNVIATDTIFHVVENP